MDELMKHGPDLMLNICASPFDYDHDDDREEIIRANVLKYQLPMFYCNAVGSQTEIVFDGGSLVMDAKGHVVKELKHFEEDFAVIDFPVIPDLSTVNRQRPLSTKTCAFPKSPTPIKSSNTS